MFKVEVWNNNQELSSGYCDSKWDLHATPVCLITSTPNCICEVITWNESYIVNIDFEIYPIIVWNSFCILLVSGAQNCLYLWNHKSNFDEIFCKTKLSGCFTKSYLIVRDIRLTLLDRITYTHASVAKQTSIALLHSSTITFNCYSLCGGSAKKC